MKWNTLGYYICIEVDGFVQMKNLGNVLIQGKQFFNPQIIPTILQLKFQLKFESDGASLAKYLRNSVQQKYLIKFAFVKGK